MEALSLRVIRLQLFGLDAVNGPGAGLREKLIAEIMGLTQNQMMELWWVQRNCDWYAACSRTRIMLVNHSECYQSS